MTREPNPDLKAEPHDDPLDGLLAQARWPEPSPPSRGRLQSGWEANWRRQASRLYIGRIAAIAAALLLAIDVAWKVYRPVPRSPVRIVEVVNKVAAGDSHPFPPVVVSDDGPFPSRPANLYERLALVFKEDSEKTPKQAAAKAATKPSQVPSPVPSRPIVTLSLADQNEMRRIAITSDHAVRQELLGKLFARGTAGDLEAFLQMMLTPDCRDDALRVVQTAASRPDAALLFARFDDAHVDCRFAAAKILGTMCDAHVRAELCRMVRANIHRREALAALLCCQDADASHSLEAGRADRSFDAQLRSVRGEIDRLF